jgi:ribose transport system substrate-binding protein
MFRKPLYVFLLVILSASLLLSACGQATTTPAVTEPAAPAATEPAAPAATEPAAPAATEPAAPAATEPAFAIPTIFPSTSSFFNADEFKRQMELLTIPPEGPADKPWEQAIAPDWVDTSAYKKDGPYTICFSNAGLFNPWRVVGFTTMKEEVKLHSEIKDFIVYDAGGKDEKQIADIEDALASGKCDILIVSPMTTEALTPIVEKASKQVPTIVFDRGVATDAPITFIAPIGGYAFGAQAANFIVQNLPKDGKVLALRISPGVDVLETRWAAAEQIFKANNINVIGVEFTGDDRAKAKSIVNDYLDRYGSIDAVWMDAGATSVAVIEAFEERGLPIPIITGEDQQDFLVKWKETGMKAIAPTYPTFQWRTAIIAALKILKGEKVPHRWVLPQPTITAETLDKYIRYNMPPQHYSMCGCEEMPTYPEAWGGTK